MNIPVHLPELINWLEIADEAIEGEMGFALVKTKMVGDIRVRRIAYSANYKSDHWCTRGHIVQVLQGQLNLEHEDGSTLVAKAGSGYIVGENTMGHKAFTKAGAIAWIVD